MTPASSPANRRTLAVAASSAVDGEDVQLLGRVLATDATALRLTDESGEVQIIHGGLAHAAGDWVRLDAHAVDGMLHAEAIEVLTPHRGARPFPSPGGEYFACTAAPGHGPSCYACGPAAWRRSAPSLTGGATSRFSPPGACGSPGWSRTWLRWRAATTT